ncbi:MAG: type II toxin-antitoxin system VapC family toxin [Verrucomicrobiota bacterium]
MRVLIDTQVVIWLAGGVESQLTPAAKRCFEEADALFLSVVSYWEIAIRRSVKKLKWDDRENDASARGLGENQIEEIAIRHAHCDKVATLPRHHRDPFDRMLIAQAQVEDFAILSRDREFAKYDVRVVW